MVAVPIITGVMAAALSMVYDANSKAAARMIFTAVMMTLVKGAALAPFVLE